MAVTRAVIHGREPVRQGPAAHGGADKGANQHGAFASRRDPSRRDTSAGGPDAGFASRRAAHERTSRRGLCSGPHDSAAEGVMPEPRGPVRPMCGQTAAAADFRGGRDQRGSLATRLGAPATGGGGGGGVREARRTGRGREGPAPYSTGRKAPRASALSAVCVRNR